MTLQSPQPNPYAIERLPVNETRFIRIEFYKDGEQHRVWPYIGRSSGIRHFVVPGVFETQSEAREAVRQTAQKYLAIEDWECYV